MELSSELAARLDAAVCPGDPRQPLHITREAYLQLVAKNARIADTLAYLRQYLSESPDLANVPAREVWNRLCPRYFDPNRHDPDELKADGRPGDRAPD